MMKTTCDIGVETARAPGAAPVAGNVCVAVPLQAVIASIAAGAKTRKKKSFTHRVLGGRPNRTWAHKEKRGERLSLASFGIESPAFLESLDAVGRSPTRRAVVTLSGGAEV